MAEVTLSTGDVVRLNSRGPEMTINGFRDGMVYCKWFVDKELKEGSFTQKALNLLAKKD